MGSLNITKSKFMEYVRCNRYPALSAIYNRKDLDDASKERYLDVLYSLSHFESLDEDFLIPDTSHLDTMMPYFNEVEVLAAKKVMALFGGETKYGIKFGEQKLFMRDYDNFNLMCYVDVFNKVDSKVNIIEVKATTSNKFMKLSYKEEKIEYPIFDVGEDNVLRLRELFEPSLLEHKKYMNQRKKLFDRMNDAGIYVYDLAFQKYVIDEDIKDAKYYLGVLNHEYIFDGTYIDDKANYSDDIIRLVDLTVIVKELLPRIESDLKIVTNRIINDDEKRVDLGKHCQLKKMRECAYKDLCYDQFPKKNSILMYLDRHHGFKDENNNKYDLWDLVNDGNRRIEDLPYDILNRRNNRIQYEVATSKKPYLDIRKIHLAIKEIKYPIYHLDFESFPCPLPRFKGEKPYTQSVFQFSLHIERSEGQCDKEQDHYEFLASDHSDQREDLVKKMCHYIKDDGGSVMVYNQSFEKTRIKELANWFPAYKEKLLSINDRLYDLMYIVKTNTKFYVELGLDEEEAKTINYYHEDLSGSFSIKKVLPIFSDLSYKGMDVADGMMAVYAYASFNKLTEEELRQKRTALTEYCKQDTWAMVEILKELRKI